MPRQIPQPFVHVDAIFGATGSLIFVDALPMKCCVQVGGQRRLLFGAKAAGAGGRRRRGFWFEWNLLFGAGASIGLGNNRGARRDSAAFLLHPP